MKSGSTPVNWSMSKPSRDTDSSSSQKPKRRPSLNGTDVSKGNSSVQTSKSVKSKLLKQAQQHPLEELLGPVVKHSNGETVSPKVLAGEGGVIGEQSEDMIPKTLFFSGFFFFKLSLCFFLFLFTGVNKCCTNVKPED